MKRDRLTHLNTAILTAGIIYLIASALQWTPPPRPAPAIASITITVHKHHTAIHEDGELVTIFTDDCDSPAIYSSNGHTCAGDHYALADILDAYAPLPIGYLQIIGDLHR